MITKTNVSNCLHSKSTWLLYVADNTGAYWSGTVCERVSENTRASAVQTQLERSCRVQENWFTQQAGLFFTTTKGRRGYKSNRSAEKTPQRQGLCVLNTQERWPNEFMAAELISCAIKVLRFFPCNTNGFTKLIEPLTANVSIPMFCKSIDLRALK